MYIDTTITFYVYKNESIDQILLPYKQDKDKWEIEDGLSYGNYSGNLVKAKGFSTSEPILFVFKKMEKQ
ncbi:hypothetical protein [Methanobrevibacter filiformis]|uniref:hypothetical protein n=1 Tax=Methanobrevibacter filiformis TaxID=55758 RepID=UPI0012ED8E30|nr:hypothetical protein [Methanobrevibacter filiformis]